MKKFLSVGEVAERFPGVTPKLLTSLFYRKLLDTKRCQMVVGRRLIPPTYVPAIAAKLVELGYVSE